MSAQLRLGTSWESTLPIYMIIERYPAEIGLFFEVFVYMTSILDGRAGSFTAISPQVPRQVIICIVGIATGHCLKPGNMLPQGIATSVSCALQPHTPFTLRRRSGVTVGDSVFH